MFFIDCAAGDDAGTGGQDRPWKTPSVLARRDLPTDAVVFLRRGCTWDGAVVLKSDGVALTAYGQGEAPTITAKNAPKEQGAVTVTSRGGLVADLRITDTAGPAITLAGDHSIAHNLQVERAAFGVRFTAPNTLADQVHVKNLHLFTATPKAQNSNDDSGAVGFNVETDDVTVQNSSCENCRAPSDDYGMDGGFVEVWRKGSRLRILNNRAKDVQGLMEVGGMAGDGTVSDVTIAGNRMTGVHERAFYVNDRGDYKIQAENVTVRDNHIALADGAQVVTGGAAAFDIDGSNRIGADVQVPGAEGAGGQSSASVPSAVPTQPPPSSTAAASPAATPNTAESRPAVQSGSQAGGQAIRAYVTGYTWQDNTPNESARISHPVLHQQAGGVGTFEDPITVAVGHSCDGDCDTGDEKLAYPAGTRFYFPHLKAYGIVEDTCGDGPNPQNGPCWRLDTPGNSAPSGSAAWLDVFVGGQGLPVKQVQACAGAVTGQHEVIVNPGPGLSVADRAGIVQSGGRCDTFPTQ